MPKDPNRQVTVIEGLIVGGLVTIGLVTGQVPLAALAAGVGSSLAASLTERGIQQWRKSWATDHGVLDDDIAKVLLSAFKNAVSVLERDWKRHPHYLNLQRQNASAAQQTLGPYRWLREDATHIFNESENLATALKHSNVFSLLQRDEQYARQLVSDMLEQYLYGHDEVLVDFIRKQLVDEWLLQFVGVILHSSNEEGTRAWRHLKLLWRENLQIAVGQIEQNTTQTLTTVQWLQAWAEQLEAPVHDSTGQSALDLAIQPVIARLDKVKSSLERLERAQSQQSATSGIKLHSLKGTAQREKYFESLLKIYGKITLPIGPAESGIPLQRVFQSLLLRHSSIDVNTLPITKHRALLGEQVRETNNTKHLLFDQNRKLQKDEVDVIAEDATDALHKSPNLCMIILGAAGTGKTTLLQDLLLQATHDALTNTAALMPIFISLPALAEAQKKLPEKNLENYLPIVAQSMGLDKSFSELLWQNIALGKAFVCLDNLDEVNPNARSALVEMIKRETSNGGTWIVGSRFTDYYRGQFGNAFTEWEIKPLDHSRRKQLANKLIPILHQLLHQSKRDSQIEKQRSAAMFLRVVEQHPIVAVWGENPLLFSLMAAVFVEKGDLPNSRTELYQKVIDAVLKLRAPDSGQRVLVRWKLAEIALWIHTRQQSEFREEELLKELFRSWGHEIVFSHKDTLEVANQMKRSGVLKVVARETFGFWHPTFREYLAASRLAQRVVEGERAVWDFIYQKQTYSRWTEILCLMVGLLVNEHGETGVQHAKSWLLDLVGLQQKVEGDVADFGLSLALKSLSEIAGMSEWRDSGGIELEVEVVKTWANELVASVSNRQEKRQRRLVALAHEIGRLSTTAISIAVESLVASIRTGYWWGMREPAVEALITLGERVPIQLLAPIVYSENEEVRLAAVKVMGGLGRRAPVDKLESALRDKSGIVRAAAVSAIGKLGKRTLANRLVFALRDKNGRVREAAVEALGKMKTKALINRLIDSLGDEDETVREAAVEAIGNQAAIVPVDRLLLASQTGGWEIRAAAIEALGKLGERVPAKPLEEALRDPNEWVRRAAILALGERGKNTPIALLKETLYTDKDEVVRAAAVEALRKQGNRAPILALLHALRDHEPWVWENAVSALKTLRIYVPVDLLITDLHNTDKEVRKSAAWVLGMLGKHSSIAPLEGALRDTNEEVRAAAAEALGELGESAPIAPLVVALQDPALGVCRAAITSLGKKGDCAPAEQILAALSNLDRKVYTAATEILEMLKDQESFKPYLVHLQNKDHDVQQATLQKLKELVLNEQPLCGTQEKNEWMTQLLGEQASENYIQSELEDEEANRIARELDMAHDSLGIFNENEIEQKALKESGIQVILDRLVRALGDSNEENRATAAELSGSLGRYAPIRPLLEALGDSSSDVRRSAAWALKRTHPHVLLWVVPEAAACLLDQGISQIPYPVIESVRKSFIAEEIGKMMNVSKGLLDELITLLHWPYWEVQMKAARALGNIHRNIPNDVINHLRGLRQNSLSQAVREAADDALADILLLEPKAQDGGIEIIHS